jgi:hypothetical protein
MKDERIQTTINHITRRVFLIWFLLMLISLNYRLWILKQHPREWWDIFAIWVIGLLYGFIAFANKGVFDHGFKRLWLTIGIVNLILLFTLFFIMGQIHSVVDVGVYLISYLPAMGLVIGIAYFLNRRWEQKEGIEDEK